MCILDDFQPCRSPNGSLLLCETPAIQLPDDILNANPSIDRCDRPQRRAVSPSPWQLVQSRYLDMGAKTVDSERGVNTNSEIYFSGIKSTSNDRSITQTRNLVKRYAEESSFITCNCAQSILSVPSLVGTDCHSLPVTRAGRQCAEGTLSFIDIPQVCFYIGFILDGFVEYEDLRVCSQGNVTLLKHAEIFLVPTPRIITSQMTFQFVKGQPIIIEVRLGFLANFFLSRLYLTFDIIID